MTKRTTRSALLVSALAMFLCLTMFVGTTFAWFTDSVTSSGNKIVAGSLKVDLEVLEADNTTWTSVKDSNAAIFDYTNWEPGYTQVKILRVVNEGSLAFKWKATLNSTAGVSDLAKVIDVYVSETVTTYPTDRADLSGWDKLGTLDKFIDTIETTTVGSIEPNDTKDANQTLAIAFKMQEDAGNEYQEMTLGEFDLTITATQLEFESDSFGDQYDAFAEYDGEVSNAAALTAAFANGGNYKVTADIVVDDVVVILEGKEVVLDLNGNTLSKSVDSGIVVRNYGKLTLTGNGTVDGTINNYAIRTEPGSELTINEGIVVDGGFGAVSCFGGKLTINGGDFSNEESNTTHYVVYATNNSTVVINGGTFAFGEDQYAGANGSPILASTNGSTIEINGGTFEATGGSALCYNANNIIIKGGTFKNRAYNTYGGTIEGKVANGYQTVDNGDGTWTVKGYDVSNATELTDAIANGKAVELTQDVSLDKIDLTDAITNDVVINANGHKITTTEAYGIEATSGKNITISNADVVMTKEGDYITYAAGFKIANGDYAGATITLRNCTITMANEDWAYAVNMPASVTNLNLVIDNCILEGAVAVQCWGDNNTITITNSELICNYTTYAMYTSHCVALQADSYNSSENNTLVINNCEFKYSGIDNFDSVIYAVTNYNDSNTVTVTNCTYGEKVVAG